MRSNVDVNGRLLAASDCRACRRIEQVGTIKATGRPVYLCAKRYAGYPTIQHCPDYEREPGSDDE